MGKNKKFELWTVLSIVFFLLFILILVYPMFGILKQAVYDAEGNLTLGNFTKFFEKKYYTNTIVNSFKSTICVTVISLILGTILSYFYSFYTLKGAKVIFIVSILCCMSAPFLGALSWIMLLGRNGIVTKFIKNVFGIKLGSIYGFKGILLVQCLKYYPLVFIYMNGAFRNIDNTLMEASANMGCSGIKRFFKIVLMLSMPTMLAAALMVFMQAFADFGTPMIIGEGYRTFPVEIYSQYLGENGRDYGFAAAISIIAIAITALVFFIQQWATGKFKFSISALHPVEKKKPKGFSGFLMHFYAYFLIFLGFAPNLYIIYLSFINSDGAVFKTGFSINNYKLAAKKLLARSINNTIVFGLLALAVIILFSVIVAYLIVRRSSPINHAIDTMSMLPYIMPGAVVGIALIMAFGAKPFALTGTVFIMVLNFVVRRMPYTIRSASACLMQISPSIEEAAISLGASKAKTFAKITVPMMSSGIISGAILSWVAIVTELSGSIILYNNKTITLTMSTYVMINRGNYGIACAFAAILTVVTIISLLIYIWVSKSEDNIHL